MIPYGSGELPEASRRKIENFDPTSGVLFSVREVAALLSVSTRTVGRMIDDGRLQAFRIGGTRLRIPAGSIAKVMQETGGGSL